MPIGVAQEPTVNQLGVDFAYERPTPEQIKTSGYGFVMRYLSLEPGKNITPVEMQAYHAAGISVGFVWESLADRPLGGAPNGAADGAEAGRQLVALGVPKTVPIFWALDTDPAGHPGWQAACTAYGAAFTQASGYQSYPYGSNQVIDYFGGGWQTQAWSYGQVSSHAWLLQYAGSSSPLANVDVNELFNPIALYSPTPTDWFDMATEADLENAVRRVLNEGTLPGQPSWAHQNQAMMVIANKSYRALQTVAAGVAAVANLIKAKG